MVAVLFLILVPLALALLVIDTVRVASRSGGLPGFEPTYRAYGA